METGAEQTTELVRLHENEVLLNQRIAELEARLASIQHLAAKPTAPLRCRELDYWIVPEYIFPSDLAPPAFSILKALALHAPIPLTYIQLATLARCRPHGLIWHVALSELHRRKAISADQKDRASITREGVLLLTGQALLPPPMDSKERLRMWCVILPPQASVVLRCLAKHQVWILPSTLANAVGCDVTDSVWHQAISQLQMNGLLECNESSEVIRVPAMFWTNPYVSAAVV